VISPDRAGKKHRGLLLSQFLGKGGGGIRKRKKASKLRQGMKIIRGLSNLRKRKMLHLKRPESVKLKRALKRRLKKNGSEPEVGQLTG